MSVRIWIVPVPKVLQLRRFFLFYLLMFKNGHLLVTQSLEILAQKTPAFEWCKCNEWCTWRAEPARALLAIFKEDNLEVSVECDSVTWPIVGSAWPVGSGRQAGHPGKPWILKSCHQGSSLSQEFSSHGASSLQPNTGVHKIKARNIAM